MDVIERIDDVLPDGVVYTKKQMANGETRIRFKMPDGSSISLTKMGLYVPEAGNMPWQDAHYHKGLAEVYTQITGWSLHAWLLFDDKTLLWGIMDKPGQTRTFFPLTQHVMLLGPGASVSTQTFGDPVGNPERKNNDWWPVRESRKKLFEKLQSDIEKGMFA